MQYIECTAVDCCEGSSGLLCTYSNAKPLLNPVLEPSRVGFSPELWSWYLIIIRLCIVAGCGWV